MPEPQRDSPPTVPARVILAAGAAACLHPAVTPQIALGAGVVLALLGAVAPTSLPRLVARYLVQGSVVLLGLTMDLHRVARAGVAGICFAAITIAGTFGAGWLLGRALRTEGRMTALLSTGTAICGGSAIAAMSSVIGATSAQTGVALAAVFILNGAALYVFPAVGHWLHLSADQFGAWAAVAIHDVSSVVGAAATFDPASQETATAIKLSRALWIAPVTLAGAKFAARSAPPAGASKASIPWFVLFFVLACVVRSLTHAFGPYESGVRAVSRAGMTCALFLIGAGLSRSAVRAVGWRPLLLATTLWVLISLAALAGVKLFPHAIG